MRLLLDTNVLIHTLDATRETRRWFAPEHNLAISLIAWMEVLVGRPGAPEAALRDFLATFTVLPITPAIAEEAVKIRRSLRIKLPDAIIYATARTTGRTLLTYNTRDFPEGTEGVQVAE